MHDLKRYSSFVEHPRYGHLPRFTGLNVKNPLNGFGYPLWHQENSIRIAGTGIQADLSKQTPATFQIDHYFDVERKCLDCSRMFIFFAAEQKHWYEELRFHLDADCVHCFPCRKKRQKLAKARRHYEDLFHTQDRSTEQTLAMAESCLLLIENEGFSKKKCQRVRRLLNQLGDNPTFSKQVDLIRERLKSIE